MSFREQVESRRLSRLAAESKTSTSGDETRRKKLPTAESNEMKPPSGMPPPPKGRPPANIQRSHAVEAVRKAIVAAPKKPPPASLRASGRALIQSRRRYSEPNSEIPKESIPEQKSPSMGQTNEANGEPFEIESKVASAPKVHRMRSVSSKELAREKYEEKAAEEKETAKEMEKLMGHKYRDPLAGQTSPSLKKEIRHSKNNQDNETETDCYTDENDNSDGCDSDGVEEDDDFTPVDPACIPISKPELKAFLYKPLRAPAEHTNPLLHPLCRCIVERDRSSPSKYMYPVFSFLIEDEVNGDRLLMVARKRPSQKANYAISTNSADLNEHAELRSDGWLGKLRQMKTTGHGGYTQEFMLFDDGLNPKRLLWNEAQRDSDKLRKEEAAIVFTQGSSDAVDRRIEIAIPAIKDSGKRALFQPNDEDDSMAILFKRLRFTGKQNVKHTKELICFNNHATKYDALSSCLVEFDKRANLVSKKNTLLQVSPPADRNQMEKWESGIGKQQGERTPGKLGKVIFRMGKLSNNCYSVDFQYPLSPFQAFGICLARFESMTLDLRLK